MDPVEAVCFDLDSTLCVSEQSDREIHGAVFEQVGIEPYFSPADIRAVEAVDLPDAASDRGFYEHLYRAAAARAGAEPRRIADLAAATVDVVDAGAVRFREGAREALAYARERYPCGLVTNGGRETQRAKLEALGIPDAFDAAVYCDTANDVPPKPDTTAFERVRSTLAVPAERTLYVGDSHPVDVVGGRRAGLQTAWVPPDRPHQSVPADPDPAPTYRLDSPGDLPEIC